MCPHLLEESDGSIRIDWVGIGRVLAHGLSEVAH